MKKFLSLCFVCVLMAALTVPAFALDDNGVQLPDIYSVWDNDKYPDAACFEHSGVYYLVCATEFKRPSKASMLTFNTPAVVYTFSPSKGDSEWQILQQTDETLFWSRNLNYYVWSSEPILNYNGEIIYEYIVPPLLSSTVKSVSFGGLLSEALAALLIALPVVAGLFGVRKGVAWLLGRIRSV